MQNGVVAFVMKKPVNVATNTKELNSPLTAQTRLRTVIDFHSKQFIIGNVQQVRTKSPVKITTLYTSVTAHAHLIIGELKLQKSFNYYF